MIGIKKIENYEEYIKLQKEKTQDPERRKKWEGNLNSNTHKFKPTFEQYLEHFNDFKNDNIYCLGARTGEEALALRSLGFKKSTGTDLVPFLDHVIEDDIHNMQFEDDSVGLFYTNIFDHSIKPDVFLKEIFRCLKPNGKAFFQLQLGSDLDKYGVLYIDKPDDFIHLASNTGLKVFLSEKNEVLTPHNHGLNWNVILVKQ
tara:strand:+ start:1853 stop:2455 length:603 start_codon:yes stop_codon:yes gene_type:complete